MDRTLEQLKTDLEYYQSVYKRATQNREFRKQEGAQQNIDRTYDRIKELKKKDR